MGKVIKVGVHDGVFHADDVIFVALIKMYNPDNTINVIRTRKEEELQKCDIIGDVGMKYDAVRYFDHHQESCPKYLNGVLYAACGLLLKNLNLKAEQYLLHHGLYAVQAKDNGQQDLIETFKENPFNYVSYLNVSWKTSLYSKEQDEAFDKAVEIAVQILKRMIDKYEAEAKMEDAIKSADSRIGNNILLLDTFIPWQESVAKYNETATEKILLVIFKQKEGDWRLQVVNKSAESFDSWIKLDKDVCMSKEDCTFVHKGLFLASFTCKESAIDVALELIK